MQAKVIRVVTAVVGSLMTMRGLTPETDFQQFFGLFTPLAVLGLVLIVMAAWNGTQKFKVPKVKTLGK